MLDTAQKKVLINVPKLPRPIVEDINFDLPRE